MRDSKSLLLLVVSVLLIVVSCALLWTLGFNFNNFAKEKGSTVIIVKDSVSPSRLSKITEEQDSLKNIYAATISNLNVLDSTWSNADSLKKDLDLKLTEFYKLRNEITTILKKPSTKEDVTLARRKIEELQKRIDQLRDRNVDVEKENQRLYAMLQQLTSASMVNENNQAKAIVYDTKPAVNTPSVLFTASDIRLTALMVEDDKEQETYQALQTDKFSGTFTVRNNAAQINSTEVYVVITQPDSKVLQASAWESGRFTSKEGTRIYTCKLKFDYSKGESKRLSFSVASDRFQKGSYTLQLYYNGSIIGKVSKTLI